MTDDEACAVALEHWRATAPSQSAVLLRNEKRPVGDASRQFGGTVL